MSLCPSLSCVVLLIRVKCCVIQEWKGCKLSLVLQVGRGEIHLFLSLNNKCKKKNQTKNQNYSFSLPGNAVVLIDLLSQGSWWADSMMKMGHRQKP